MPYFGGFGGFGLYRPYGAYPFVRPIVAPAVVGCGVAGCVRPCCVPVRPCGGFW